MNEYLQRLESILGATITEYTPNAIKFSNLSLDGLKVLLNQGFTNADSYYNGSPSIAQFIEFANRCVEIGTVATFDGVAFKNPDSNAGIDAITVIGVKDLDFVGEFVKFTRGCDELEISSQKLFAWWD
jgi:hypothetical protein